MVVELTAKQRRELEHLVARATESAPVIRRAHVVLWSVDGVAGADIARRLHLSAEAVSRIRRRFLDGGVAGLATRPKGGRRDHAVPAATVERVLELAMSPPPAGRSRWTTRLLAKEVGLTSGCVSDLLRRHGLKPHRVRTYKVSRDPDFVAKVRDIVGLYLDPPEHAVVLSVDEKTSIQALERTQRPLPLRSGRAVRHTHDYKRHGVVDLYAALEVATGASRIGSAPGIPPPTSSPSWARSCAPIRAATCTSFSTIRRPIAPRPCAPGSPRTPWCTSTTPRPARRGSIKWKGFSAFSANNP